MKIKEYKYPVINDRNLKPLTTGQIMIGVYPNGSFGFGVKNMAGMIRSFDSTCFKMAVKFSQSFCKDENKWWYWT